MRKETVPLESVSDLTSQQLLKDECRRSEPCFLAGSTAFFSPFFLSSLSLEDQRPNFRTSPIYGLFRHSVCSTLVLEQWRMNSVGRIPRCPELIPEQAGGKKQGRGEVLKLS